MDELVVILRDIQNLLISIDSRLIGIESDISEIKGSAGGSLSDVCEKLDEIKGDNLYNSLSDVCDKLDEIDSDTSSGLSGVCDKLDEIMGNALYNNLSDVCNKLDLIDMTCGNIGL